MSCRRLGDERNDKKTCLYRYFLLEVRYVKKVLHKYGFPRLLRILILYPVIETNGENHEKRTDECK